MNAYEAVAHLLEEAHDRAISHFGFYFFVAATTANPQVRRIALQLHAQSYKAAA